jgi:exodeoxyribonuclease VII small subunit
MNDDAPPSFEAAFEQLQATVALLEQGGMPLEEALALFERGMHLVAQCASHLNQADLRVLEIESALGEALAGLDEA